MVALPNQSYAVVNIRQGPLRYYHGRWVVRFTCVVNDLRIFEHHRTGRRYEIRVDASRNSLKQSIRYHHQQHPVPLKVHLCTAGTQK